MAKLNVLIYEPYPMGKVGGNLRTLSYILEFLDRSRFHPIVVTPMETEFIRRIQADGVECIVATPPCSVGRYGGQCLRDSSLGRVRGVWDVMRYNLELGRIIRQRQIDLIYCNSIRAVLCIGLAGRLRRIPVLWYIKGELQNAILDRIGFVLANRILFFCETNRDDRYPGLVRWYRNKIDILKIGIDARSIKQAEEAAKSALISEFGLEDKRINVVVLGQIYPPKGVHVALEALNSLVKDHPEVMLYIVGDHVLDEYRSYRAELERMIERDGLEGHVRFVGWRTDALRLLALMDILVHPSLSEGFGRAVLEALALGLPVVVSGVGGLREIIADGRNGFLVEPGNSAMIADRLRQLIGDKALRERLGRAGRETVFAEYLIEDKVARFGAVLREMASGANRGS